MNSNYSCRSFVNEYLYCIVLYCIVLYCIVLYCIVLCCIVLYCIVLYYEALYWWPFRPLSYRYSSGVVQNPHKTLVEWGIFKLRSMSPQGTHHLIGRRRNSITSVFISMSWKICLSATCEPRTSNLSITGERITFYNVASQPQTSDRLISHWRALCLLAFDNWRYSIQSEIFTHQSAEPESGFELLSSMLTARLHIYLWGSIDTDHWSRWYM